MSVITEEFEINDTKIELLNKYKSKNDLALEFDVLNHFNKFDLDEIIQIIEETTGDAILTIQFSIDASFTKTKMYDYILICEILSLSKGITQKKPILFEGKEVIMNEEISSFDKDTNITESRRTFDVLNLNKVLFDYSKKEVKNNLKEHIEIRKKGLYKLN